MTVRSDAQCCHRTMVQVYWKRCRTLVFISLVFLLVLFATHRILHKSNVKGLLRRIQGQARNRPIGQIAENEKAKPELRASKYVHAFYYAWYGSPQFDGKFYHWDHEFLPHWKADISRKYATGERHVPPDDIGSNFYPALGPYSSNNISIIHKHMQYCVMAGIGVLALSWYPTGKADNQGKPAQKLIPKILDVANEYGIKICFHIEPYMDRTAQSVGEDIKFLIENYGSHPAFYTTYRRHGDTVALPFVYVYDSYLISPKEWASVLKSEDGIRGTPYDAIVIGLLVEQRHFKEISEGGFDGFYTYFASSGFSYGSNLENWPQFAFGNDLIFVPSVGPGYIDTNVRPWNGANTKQRENGQYYWRYWNKALLCKTRFISITSFNEWHEGTQIEPAMSGKSVYVKHSQGKYQPGQFTYEDYGENPNLYLQLTRDWVRKYSMLVT